MKRKLLLFSAILCIYGWKANSQQALRTEGYIRNAVPPFDNKSGKVDMSKVEFLPINVYKPDPNFKPAVNRDENNSVLTVTDNIDVHVFPSANSQHEQHMTVSKINPDNIILSSNTPFYQGYYISQDGGATWFGSDHMPDNIGTSGDPTTAVTSEGHLFMESIVSGGFKSFRSTNQGTSWLAPVSHTYSPASFDKQMATIDNLPGSPYLNNIYTAWTDFSGTYKVLFNRSTNGGASFGTNINLHNSWGQGTGVATGVNGEVFVCWANYSTGGYPADGCGFSRSLDGGATFTDLTPVFPYVGIRVSNSPNPLFNNTRVNDFPSIATDKSCGFSRNKIYVAYAAKQNGVGKGVIYVRYSTNQGNSWSAPTEVSIAASQQNWFPWVTVDDATGTVSVSYLCLDQVSGFTTNTYLAYSFDGGASWSNIKVSDVGHTVAAISGFASGYCGDYIANTAWGNKNYVAWNDNRSGQWHNYVSRVDFSQMSVYSSNTDLNLNGPINLELPTGTQVFYRATAHINSPVGTSFAAQTGTNVTMLAGGHITLNPGFIANEGCHFQAFIGAAAPCVNTVHRDDVAEEMQEQVKFLKPAYTGDPTVQFSLYPNPANSDITFEYLLPDYSHVTLTIYDLQGKEISLLMNNSAQQPGLNRFNYDVSSLKNGVYIFKLITNDYVKTGKFSKAD